MDEGEKVLTDKNDYLKITIFDCLARISFLEKFKSLLISYKDGEISEHGFQDFRSDVNQKITLVEEYIATSYTPVLIGHKFPGQDEHVQVAIFREIFNPRFDEHIVQAAIDHLDIAIGRYKSVRIKSFINTISPLYWLGCFSFWLSYSLAKFLALQLTPRKFSILKLIVQIVAFFAAIAGIYNGLVTYYGNQSLWF